MALRYPDYVRGLFTFLTTGGGTIGENLAKQYYFVYADLAEKEGMGAVAKTPFWAERIALNEPNKNRLLAMDPHEFARVMRRWGKAMRSNPRPGDRNHRGRIAPNQSQRNSGGHRPRMSHCAAASPRPFGTVRPVNRGDAHSNA